MHDLMIVEYWNRRVQDRFPVSYNNFLYGGYINMPSARMGEEGEISFGYSVVPPYRNYNGRCQLLPNLEFTGNYRIFQGVDDPILSKHGFGDFSDKGANVKLAIIKPEDSDYQLPGFAIGFDDFFGTRAFASKYIVFTHVFFRQNLECSLGYGFERLKRWFGGVLWMPLRNSCYSYLRPITLVVEYDASDYKNPKHEHHPKGRNTKSPINYGIKYRLWDCIDMSASYVRGSKFSYSLSAFYNFGYTKGLLPKIHDQLPYRPSEDDAYIDYMADCSAEEVEWMCKLRKVFSCQGFDLLASWISTDCWGEKFLRLIVHNEAYRSECVVRNRLNHILAFLTPADIDKVIVEIEAEGFSVWEYTFRTEYLKAFAERRATEYELMLLTPRNEVTKVPCCARKLYERAKPLFDFEIKPNVHTLFGSSKGKFKYALGLTTGVYGFWKNIYYEFYLGYLPFNTMQGCSGIDMLNPSQLINVHTDIVLYYKRKSLTLDQAFLQRNWSIGRGWYARVAGGYFTCAYGGLAAETLYAPATKCWALGIEGASLYKRSLHGLGFTNSIRKLHGYNPCFQKFRGSQCFLNIYYDWLYAKLDFKISAGKFLANDKGVSCRISRYFPSGTRVAFWCTVTDAHDIINGKTYHDTGIEFSFPLDMFFIRSNRSVWNYGMSAWVRDAGFRTKVGEDLYPMLDELRKN